MDTEINVEDFAGPAHLANHLREVDDRNDLPAWVIAGKARTRVTRDTVQPFMRALIIASGMAERKAD